MKKLFLLLLSLSISPLLFSQKTVGVLDITPKQGVSAMEADIVTDFVHDALYRFGSDTYRIISRQNREAILAEHKFALSGFCDETSCAIEVGRYLAADYVIIGSFMKFGSNYYLSLQLVDVNTTEISGSAREGAPDLDGIAATAVDACVAGVFGLVKRAPIPAPAPGPAAAAAPAPAEQAARIPDWLIPVDGGTFEMGSRIGGSKSSKPAHKVTLSSFYISRFEVTQGLWREVMGSAPPDTSKGAGDSYPVYGISWYDAVAFCNRLSLREGLAPVYTISGTNVTWDWTKNGYRLPTEAEWEYAARGGALSRGYSYPGGNSLNAVAWNLTNSGYKTHPVGQLQGNELGLYDMAGNVYEYCWDWYGGYGSGDQRDPRGPSSGSSRVVRGCFYNGEVTYFSVYERFLRAPDSAMNTDGLRVARNR